MRRSWSPATALRTVGCRGSAVQPALVGVRARRCRLGATGRGGSPVGAAADPYRRKIARQLNKGENLRALRRDLFYASEGAIRHHNPEQQTEQAWCLTIATNAIVTWISEYYGRAIAEMRAGGHLIQDEVLAHLWPTHHDNVNFFGTITVEIDGELAKLDTDGYRPLRHIPATASIVN